jgi:hypothetical protein
LIWWIWEDKGEGHDSSNILVVVVCLIKTLMNLYNEIFNLYNEIIKKNDSTKMNLNH